MLHHGTLKHELTIMSYNILAQCYVRSSFFPYCPKGALKWKTRSQLVLQSILSHPMQPSILCLQECDQYDSFWKEALHTHGYDGYYQQKTGQKKDGVAIFWKADQYQVVRSQGVALNDVRMDMTDAEAELKDRLERDNVALFLELKSSVTGLNVIIGTTHLFWDPSQADVKLCQAKYVYRMLDSFIRATTDEDAMMMPWFILAGDFNSLPQSDVYDYFTIENRLTSAYGQYRDGKHEPAFTNVNGQIDDDDDDSDDEDPKANVGTKYRYAFAGTLDYIFYPSNRLKVKKLGSFMSLDEATTHVALPNDRYGSDHVPLVSTFELLA